MTVFIDQFPEGWGKWTGGGHLTTTNLEELHELAAKIGLKRQWFQNHGRFPHYDCQRRIRLLAIKAGAVEVGFIEQPHPDTVVRRRDGTYGTYGEGSPGSIPMAQASSSSKRSSQ